MDTHAIAKEILAIRNRLAEIEYEKNQVPDNGGEASQTLREEASGLETRMATLHGILAKRGPGRDDLEAKLHDEVSKARYVPPM